MIELNDELMKRINEACIKVQNASGGQLSASYLKTLILSLIRTQNMKESMKNLEDTFRNATDEMGNMIRAWDLAKGKDSAVEVRAKYIRGKLVVKDWIYLKTNGRI